VHIFIDKNQDPIYAQMRMKSIANDSQTNCTPIRLILLALGLTILLVACAPRRWMVNQMTGMVETGLPAFEQESDLFMLQQAMPAHIKLLETMLASSPDDERLLLLLARLYGSYAFAFDESQLDAAIFGDPDASPSGSRAAVLQTAKDRLNAHYLKGAEYALAALEIRHPGCRSALENIAALDVLLSRLTREDVPALFWYGFATGAWVNRNLDSIQALAKGHLVEKTMQRAVVLQPDYFHGSAHLVLIVYYASRPPMLGGDLPAALSHYRSLKTLAGNDFMLADLYFARYYLQQKQDRAAYEQTLAQVAQAAAGDRRYAMFNRIAKERAVIYLQAADRLFEADP
jgi:hypothetical protein